jgi:hypothetical protein
MEIVGFELLILLGLSLAVAMLLYSVTGFFVEDFIRQFII